MEPRLKDHSTNQLAHLTRLVKALIAVFVVNILITWYAIYEFRVYRQATKLLRSGTDFVETENLFRFSELDKFIQDQKRRSNITIDNKGTVLIK